MEQQIEILFKTFFPECKNDKIKIIQSSTVQGKPFFYAMHEGRTVKLFEDKMQVLYGGNTKKERMVLELTISQISVLASIYQDGTIFM